MGVPYMSCSSDTTVSDDETRLGFSHEFGTNAVSNAGPHTNALLSVWQNTPTRTYPIYQR